MSETYCTGTIHIHLVFLRANVFQSEYNNIEHVICVIAWVLGCHRPQNQDALRKRRRSEGGLDDAEKLYVFKKHWISGYS